MAKECPFKKNTSRKDNYGYLVTGDKKAAIIHTSFGPCTETECMAYDYITNTCKLLEKGIDINECSSCKSI